VAIPRPAPDQAYQLEELEAKLEDVESEMRMINVNTEKLRRSHSELVELQLVLEKAGGFFDEARADANAHRDDMDRPTSGGGGAQYITIYGLNDTHDAL